MQAIIDELALAADPEGAAAVERYFKVQPGEYGDGDEFLGIKMGVQRAIAKPYTRIEFAPADWTELLRSPVHEHRMTALIVMSERAARGSDAEQARIYRMYRKHTRYVNNWDLVDVSAAPIVGGYLTDRDRGPLDPLAESKSLWERRIAIVSTYHFIRRGETADTYRLAVRLIEDDHDLIHKAVGWMLREAGKRVNAQELREFLDEYATRLPRTALRYAIERFPADERKRYLALR